jgi:hypothetical protein
MLRGRFGNTSGRPFLEGRVALPRLGITGDISFLVDTGADHTVIMPIDAGRLAIPFNLLGNKVLSSGIGGSNSNFQEPAILVFSDIGVSLHAYFVDVWIADPTTTIPIIPSLLGRNLMNNWNVICAKPQDRLEAEVVFDDLRISLTPTSSAAGTPPATPSVP